MQLITLETDPTVCSLDLLRCPIPNMNHHRSIDISVQPTNFTSRSILRLPFRTKRIKPWVKYPNLLEIARCDSGQVEGGRRRKYEKEEAREEHVRQGLAWFHHCFGRGYRQIEEERGLRLDQWMLYATRREREGE